MSQGSDVPLVSVAMATYNGAAYLKAQIDSILAQDHPRLELVVSDDQSSDGTRAILEDYAQQGRFIIAPNDARLGYRDNFVNAMRHCKGDYIALADQDDIWLPEKVSVLLGLMQDRLLVHGDAEQMAPDTTPVYSSLRRAVHGVYHDRVFLDADYHRASLLTRKSLCQGCTVLLDRRLMDQALPIPPSEQAHDIWFAFVAAALDKVAYIDRPLIRWRRHAANTSQGGKRSTIKRLLNGGLVHHLKRQLEYRRRRAVLRERGVAMGGYPVRLRDELYY